MARYIRDFRFEENAQEAYKAVLNFFDDNGYRKKDYEYDEVYTKGKGVFSNPKFYKVSLVDQVLRLEAWGMVCYSFGVFGSERHGTNPKAHMKAELEKLDALLTDLGGQCVSVDPTGPQVYSDPPLVTGEENRKEFRQKHLCPSLLKELRKLMVTACFVTVIMAILGVLASDKLVEYIAVASLSVLSIAAAIFMYVKRSYWGGLGLIALSVVWVVVCVLGMFLGGRAIPATSRYQAVLYGAFTGAMCGVFAAVWGMVGVGTQVVFRKIHKYFRFFVKGKK